MWAGLRGGRGHPHLRGLNAINTHLGGAGNKETPKMGIPPLPPLQELGRTPKKGGGGESGNEVTPKTRGTPPGNGETPKNWGHPSTSPKKWGDPPPKQVVEVHQELGGRGHNGGHPQEVGDPHGMGGKWGPPPKKWGPLQEVGTPPPPRSVEVPRDGGRQQELGSRGGTPKLWGPPRHGDPKST